MASNSAFTLQGSTPTTNQTQPSYGGSSAFSNALNRFGNWAGGVANNVGSHFLNYVSNPTGIDKGFNKYASNVAGGAIKGFLGSTPTTPTDAPTPTGIANFRANDPSTYGGSTSNGLLSRPNNQDVKSQTHPDGTTVSYYPSSSSKTNNPGNQGSTQSSTQQNSTTTGFGANGLPYGQTSDASGNNQQAGSSVNNKPVQGTALGQATSGLLKQPYSANSAIATNASGQLLNSPSQNQALGQNAQNIANAAGNAISNVGQAGARGQAGYLTTGTSPVGEGNAAVLAQTTAQQQQAIAKGAEAQLTGNQQALTAQNQAQSGLEGAASGAVAGQNANTTALSGAASQSQPVSQFGVLGTPQSVGNFGSNTGSAAFQGGYIQGQQGAGQTAAQMNVANTAAKGIQGTIQQYLQANPQLNSSGATLANAAQQWLQGKQLGDPAYQTLFNYLNEYISTLAPILGVGGDTTNLKTEIAQSFVNAQASGQSISTVLNNIGTLADQKLQNIMSAGQGGGQVAGGVPVGENPTSFGSEW